ncbi:MAG: hypothetical protein MJZ69_02920 [Bacteroidaceae bacterium]|nr:hypothetical protein [Candidatus Minthousia equi]MCQ2245726.1 hypothetical protein [Bacteroidaceae bacterium]
MKKVFTLCLVVTLLTSCFGSGQQLFGSLIGADLGGHIGGVIGRGTGGLTGDVFGTIIGTVAGAAIGSAVSAPPKDDDHVAYVENDAPGAYERPNRYASDYDATTNHRSSVSEHSGHNHDVKGLTSLKVTNVRFIDDNKNRVINSNETCSLVFDVYNGGDTTVYGITPIIYAVSQQKYIDISKPNVIKVLEPGQSASYTIIIRTGKELKNGTATFCIELSDENGTTIPCREFDLQTAR